MSNINSNKGFTGDLFFLSNYYMCSVRYEGIVYPSSEHAFAAVKTLDNSLRLFISEQPTPGAAKRAGRGVKLRPSWDNIRIRIMRDILRCKFEQNPHLKEKLLNTFPDYLEETNTWNDTFWGVCNGVGDNNLGNLLMELRAEWLENDGHL